MQPSPDTASFFLPGLVHQFGNLLLTVQGHVLHLDEPGIQRMQEAVMGVVQRGSASLQVMRALLGEQTGAAGSAGDLIEQLVELGRVPSRERGITLELAETDEAAEPVWVAAEPFVLACAETLRRWMRSMPIGTSGKTTVTFRPAPAGGALVTLAFELAAGSLPFPMALQELADEIAGELQPAGGTAHVPQAPERAIELHFRPATFTSS